MILHTDMRPTIAEMDSLFPPQPYNPLRGKAEEALQSHISIGFDEALGLGMSPMEALSHVLCWVASEMVRLRAGQVPQSTASTSSEADYSSAETSS